MESGRSEPASEAMIVLVALLGLAVALEIAARAKGFGDPPLYASDPHCNYAIKPNQDLNRFGSRIRINRWGMRSEDLPDVPGAGTLRVLFLGDSVMNGTPKTTQAQTIPYLVAAQLGPGIETLNPSCGGWAPANELAWLESRGLYSSQVLVIGINDTDLYQPMAPDITDTYPGYPRRRPLLALQELLFRYLLPRLLGTTPKGDPGTWDNLPAPELAAASRAAVLAQITLAQSGGAKAIVLLTRENAALKQTPGIEEMRSQMEAAVSALGVPFVDCNIGPADYRDAFHPNEAGYENIAAQIAPFIRAARGPEAGDPLCPDPQP